jgi:hypothetical protein
VKLPAHSVPSRATRIEKKLSSGMPEFFGVNDLKRPLSGSRRLIPPAHVATHTAPPRSTATSSTASEFRFVVRVSYRRKRPVAGSRRLSPPPSVATHTAPRASSAKFSTELPPRLAASPAMLR